MHKKVIEMFKKRIKDSDCGLFLESIHGTKYEGDAILWIPELSSVEHKEIKIEIEPYVGSKIKYEPSTSH